MLKAILLIAFLNVICAAPDIKDCDVVCEDNDKKPVCVLDNKEVCFRFLTSKCEMDRMNCCFQLGFKVYIDDYCELEAFKCKDQPIFQLPSADNEQVYESRSSFEKP